jgi:hypothetical protein
MERWFSVAHLDVERLLKNWRWLCPQELALVARNAFGDLFLRDNGGNISWLDVAVGKLTKVSESEAEFRLAAETTERQNEWFAQKDFRNCESRGLNPTVSECIAFPIPLVFAEPGKPNAPYILDIYECVSFLGDMNGQIVGMPDGTKVTLRVVQPENRST